MFVKIGSWNPKERGENSKNIWNQTQYFTNLDCPDKRGPISLPQLHLRWKTLADDRPASLRSIVAPQKKCDKKLQSWGFKRCPSWRIIPVSKWLITMVSKSRSSHLTQWLPVTTEIQFGRFFGSTQNYRDVRGGGGKRDRWDAELTIYSSLGGGACLSMFLDMDFYGSKLPPPLSTILNPPPSQSMIDACTGGGGWLHVIVIYCFYPPPLHEG